jgi:hypothetical protein
VDAIGWVEFLVPLAVALFAVWLGYTYQIISLDRETRKNAYVDAVSSLVHLRDLIELAEQVNYASWSLAVRTRESKPTPSEKAGLNDWSKSLIHWIVRSREIASRLGVAVDWSAVGDFDHLDLGEDLRSVRGKLFTAFLREGELVREKFNDSIIHVASVTRLGVFWLVIRRKSETQRRTTSTLWAVYDQLDGVFSWVAAVTTDPRPVNWPVVESLLDKAVTAIFVEIGSLGHVNVGLRPQHERIPWPREIFESDAVPKDRQSSK